jgi:hypothetical protein
MALGAIVIVVVPIAIGVPAVLVFIPPAMRAAVTILASFVKVVPGLVGLAAIATMM